MQHQVANLVGSLNGQPPVLTARWWKGRTGSVLVDWWTNMMKCPPEAGCYKKFNGNGSVYKDNVQSYTTDEPAIDLTATSFLMYAWGIAGGPSGMWR